MDNNNENLTTEYEAPEQDSDKLESEKLESEKLDGAAVDAIADDTEREQPDEPELSGGQARMDGQEEKPETKDSTKKKRVLRILRNLLLVGAIALGILSLFGIMNELKIGDGASIGEILRGASPLFGVVLLTVIVLIMVFDVLQYCLISKTVTGKFHVGTSTKMNFIGRYYDAVTPFSTGGQPMQIYYLNSKGVSGGNSSAMVLIRYFASILCWIILGAALMIWGTVKGVLDDVSGGNILKITGWIGIAVNLIVPTFVLFFLILPKFMNKLTVGIVKLGKKMKIVKDVDKATARATKIVTDFKQAFKLMATSPVKLVLLILVSFAESALTFAVPFFVMKAFSCPVDGRLLTIMTLNVFATFGVSFVPTPGNSGVVEGMGALAFSMIAGSTLIWSVITWRLSVYYIYIIIGLVITVYDIIKKNVKDKKSAKVEAESGASNDVKSDL